MNFIIPHLVEVIKITEVSGELSDSLFRNRMMLRQVLRHSRRRKQVPPTRR